MLHSSSADLQSTGKMICSLSPSPISHVLCWQLYKESLPKYKKVKENKAILLSLFWLNFGNIFKVCGGSLTLLIYYWELWDSLASRNVQDVREKGWDNKNRLPGASRLEHNPNSKWIPIVNEHLLMKCTVRKISCTSDLLAGALVVTICQINIHPSLASTWSSTWVHFPYLISCESSLWQPCAQAFCLEENIIL